MHVPEGLEGIGAFHNLVAGYVGDPADVVIGIETDRGLWVHALVAAGYQVYAINPLTVSRYRDRHTVSGAKSDEVVPEFVDFEVAVLLPESAGWQTRVVR